MNHSHRKNFLPVFSRTGRWISCLLTVAFVLTWGMAARGADKTDSLENPRKASIAKKSRRKSNSSQSEKTAQSASSSAPDTPPAEPVAVPHGKVPDFSSPGGTAYSTQSENEFYYRMLQRRADTLAPNAPAKLRFYSDYIIRKYDKNKDGLLQESEWQALPGAQGIDVNGDFVLSSDELLFYLVRYSQNRTIFRPDVSKAPSRRHEVVTQGTVRLQPLSARTKPVTKSASKRTKTDKELADYNQEQVKKMLSDAEASVKKTESDDDLEAAEKLLESVKPSQVREYAVSATEIKGMPRWFILRDTNGDGQLSLREFAPGLDVESVAFFGKLDLNADGLVTPEELRSSVAGKK